LVGKLEISRPLQLLGIHRQRKLAPTARSRAVCSGRSLAWEVAPSTEPTPHSNANADPKGPDRTSKLASSTSVGWKPHWQVGRADVLLDVDNLKVGGESAI